jgi:hypothetical protein
LGTSLSAKPQHPSRPYMDTPTVRYRVNRGSYYTNWSRLDVPRGAESDEEGVLRGTATNNNRETVGDGSRYRIVDD